MRFRKELKNLSLLVRRSHLAAVSEAEQCPHTSSPVVIGKRYRYANLLRQCTDLHEGKCLHVEIDREGYACERFLGNLLVDMYGRCGSLKDASSVFERITEKNLFSWTIITTACVQNRQEKLAIKLFQEMCAEGFLPDRVAFVTVVGACCSLGDLEQGRFIHSLIVDAGMEADTVLKVALINMYAKAGDFSTAEELFHGLELRNAVSYTAMIAAYTQFRRNREAYRLYQEMHFEGVKPDRVTLLSALGACDGTRDGEAVHFCISSMGVQHDDVVASALIHMYGRCRELELAKRVFESIPWSAVVVWNSMISTYTQNGGLEQAMKLYDRMAMEGVTPDAVTTVEILGVCGQLQELGRGRRIHKQVVEKGLYSDATVVDTLLNMYRDCGSIEDAYGVFQEVASREDVVAWNTMIGAYVEQDCPERALQLYHGMALEGVEPTEVTLMAALAACTSLQALSQGKAVHQRIISLGYDVFLVVNNSLVQFYGACEQLKAAVDVFEASQAKDEVSWNTMMAIYSQHGQFDQALLTFRRMDLEGVEKNNVTFVSVLGACTGLGESIQGRSVHARIVSCGRQRHSSIGNALVDMYGKFGQLEEAVLAFEEITQRSTVSWNALMCGFSQQGRSGEAVEIFRRMQLAGLEPDSTTYQIILFACSHGGLVHEALTCFASLVEDPSTEATQEHYGCVMDLLARAGWMDKAEELMRSMPFEPDSTSVMTFLGACKVQGDMQRGGSVAELNGSGLGSAPYIMLSNMFTNENI